jgi:hypothetical protein
MPIVASHSGHRRLQLGPLDAGLGHFLNGYLWLNLPIPFYNIFTVIRAKNHCLGFIYLESCPRAMAGDCSSSIRILRRSGAPACGK